MSLALPTYSMGLKSALKSPKSPKQTSAKRVSFDASAHDNEPLPSPSAFDQLAYLTKAPVPYQDEPQGLKLSLDQLKPMKNKDIYAVHQFGHQTLPIPYNIEFYMQFLYSTGTFCYYLPYGELDPNTEDPEAIAAVVAGKFSHQQANCHVYILAVAPGLQQSGVGSAIMRVLQQTIFDEQLSRYTAHTHLNFVVDVIADGADVESPQGFYEKLGFRAQGAPRRGYYGGQWTSVKMVKSIDL